VVLNWNGSADTLKAVESLSGQVGIAKVLVIDNASEPNDQCALRRGLQGKDEVELLVLSQNLGFGRAHNLAFKQLKQEGYSWVACLNNDAIASEEWLHNLLTTQERTGAHMVSSRMIQAANPNRIDNVGHEMLSTGEIIPCGHGALKEEFTQEVDNLGPCAGACLYDLEMLQTIDFFDERFFVGYEDAELGVRAWLCGYRSVYAPKAIVYHQMGASLGKVRSEDYLIEIQSHIFYTWFKLMPRTILWSQFPAMVFKYGMVLLIDVVFLRFRFLRVMWSAIKKSAGEYHLIMDARRKFHSSNEVKRSWYSIYSNLQPFLLFDIKRFWKFVIKGDSSNLEV